MHSVAQTSKDSGEGTGVLTNQLCERNPGEQGQSNHKICHVQRQVGARMGAEEVDRRSLT